MQHCLQDCRFGRDAARGAGLQVATHAAMHARLQVGTRYRTSWWSVGREAMQHCLPDCSLPLKGPRAPGLKLPNTMLWPEIILTLKINNEILFLLQTILMIALVSSIESGTFIYSNLEILRSIMRTILDPCFTLNYFKFTLIILSFFPQLGTIAILY